MGGRRWTEDEVTYLESRYGQITVEGIARRLGRTVNSVHVKAQTLRLGRNRPFDVFSMHELQEILGMDAHSTVRRWIRDGLLPAKQHSRYGRTNRPEWWIREKDVIAFLRQHPEQIPDLSRVQPYYRQFAGPRWITFVEAFRRGGAWPFFYENAVRAGLMPEARKKGATGTVWVIPETELPRLIEARRRMTNDIQHRRLVRQYDIQQAKGAVKRKMTHLNKAARQKAS